MDMLYHLIISAFPFGFNFLIPVAGVSWAKQKTYSNWEAEFVQSCGEKGEDGIDSTFSKNSG